MGRSVTWKSSRFVTEEIASLGTHGLGFALSLPAGWWLLRVAAERQNPWLLTGCSIYAVTLSLLYAASTLSHSLHRGIWRHRFRTLDQVCIFLLIAGNYTPFGMTFLRDGWWGVLLVLMWLLAAIGIALKLFFKRLNNVTLSFYLLMGWIPICAMPQFVHCLGSEGVAWILAGGTAYSAGTWFLAHDERPFFHTTWHLFVMAGSACHFVVILNYVVPCTGPLN